MTNKLHNLHHQIPTIAPKNFCISPFQSIRQNAFGRNSPCAFGAGEWHHGHLTPEERWQSDELNILRQQFINNEKPEACKRCWDEEAAGKQSLRQRQYQYFPNDYNEFKQFVLQTVSAADIEKKFGKTKAKDLSMDIPTL